MSRDSETSLLDDGRDANGFESLPAAIGGAHGRNDPEARTVRVLTSDPNSPTFRAVMQCLNANDAADLSLRVVFTDFRNKKEALRLIEQLSNVCGSAGIEDSVRCSRASRANEIGDFVQVGGRDLWITDVMSGDRLTQQVASNDPSGVENREALELFEFVWQMSDRLPASFAQKALRKAA